MKHSDPIRTPLAIRVWLAGVVAFVALLTMAAVFAEGPVVPPQNEASNSTADDYCASVLFLMEDPECFAMPSGWEDGAFAAERFRQTVRARPQAAAL